MRWCGGCPGMKWWHDRCVYWLNVYQSAHHSGTSGSWSASSFDLSRAMCHPLPVRDRLAYIKYKPKCSQTKCLSWIQSLWPLQTANMYLGITCCRYISHCSVWYGICVASKVDVSLCVKCVSPGGPAILDLDLQNPSFFYTLHFSESLC